MGCPTLRWPNRWMSPDEVHVALAGSGRWFGRDREAPGSNPSRAMNHACYACSGGRRAAMRANALHPRLRHPTRDLDEEPAGAAGEAASPVRQPAPRSVAADGSLPTAQAVDASSIDCVFGGWDVCVGRPPRWYSELSRGERAVRPLFLPRTDARTMAACRGGAIRFTRGDSGAACEWKVQRCCL